MYKVKFNNNQLWVNEEFFNKLKEKFPIDDKGLKFDSSFAHHLVIEENNNWYKLVPITSQHNERPSMQLEAYWELCKDYYIKFEGKIPIFYKQWFVNRGLMRENKMAKYKLNGKTYNTKTFTSDKEANKFMTKNKGWGVIGIEGSTDYDPKLKRNYTITGKSNKPYIVHVARVNDLGENKIKKSELRKIIKEEIIKMNEAAGDFRDASDPDYDDKLGWIVQRKYTTSKKPHNTLNTVKDKLGFIERSAKKRDKRIKTKIKGKALFVIGHQWFLNSLEKSLENLNFDFEVKGYNR